MSSLAARNNMVRFFLPLTAICLLLLNGCTNYDPVPIEKCTEVVKHAQKVLGSMAPDAKTMMEDCKSASDSERGCVMAATKKGALAQCM